MEQKTFWTAAVILIFTLMFATSAGAQTYQVLYTFVGGPDGAFPEMRGPLVFDAEGNLYGTNDRRGNPGNWNGQGVVFKLTPGVGGTWTETSLYIFCPNDWNVCSDGAYPGTSVIFDKAGTLYGATILGGTGSCYIDGIYGCGVIFKLAPNPDHSWTYTALYKFTGGSDGSIPIGRLTFDKNGNLYGTTSQGGLYGVGVVYALRHNQNDTWTEQVLHHFKPRLDGENPEGGLIFDEAGNLYGEAPSGGAYRYGTIFKLSPNSDGSWSRKVLHYFTGGRDGGNPYGGLFIDATGNLYGTTQYGGAYGNGVIFKGTPKPDGSWGERVLHHFTGGKDGANPYSTLVIDGAGNLYGMTQYGGAYGAGVIFKGTPKPDGSWSGRVLHEFTGGEDGGWPVGGGLTVDVLGNLYGTANGGGDLGCNFGNGCGVVFEITP